MRYDPQSIDKFNDSEKMIIERLPSLPALAGIRTSKVSIFEWLWPGDRHTGFELHGWMEGHKPGWSEYVDCPSKEAFFQSLARLTANTNTDGDFPVLHIESHGDEHGLEGPGGVIAWEELTHHLAALNEATKCNLLVVIAACTGFSALLALTQGPRAPAVVIVGPAAELSGGALFAATKQLYSNWSTGNLRLMVDQMSDSTDVLFEFEPFAALCYESLIDFVVDRFRLAKDLKASAGIAEAVNALPDWKHLQGMWDHMFFMDRFPVNRERFGLDCQALVDEFIAEI